MKSIKLMHVKAESNGYAPERYWEFMAEKALIAVYATPMNNAIGHSAMPVGISHEANGEKSFFQNDITIDMVSRRYAMDAIIMDGNPVALYKSEIILHLFTIRALSASVHEIA